MGGMYPRPRLTPNHCYPRLVPDPSFSQAERPNLVVPITLAIVLLAAATFLVLHFTPHTTADLTITHTAVWQAHTVFKSDTILVKKDKSQDDLYVLTTLRVEDRLRLPLFLKDFTATLTTADGQTVATSAAEHPDLLALYNAFPPLKALATPPLLRETQIEPGHSAEGMVLFHFPMTEDAWNKRQSATLSIDLYHQASQTVTIPK